MGRGLAPQTTLVAPRAVEKHVANLMAKLGAGSRRELGSRAGLNT